MAAYPGEWAFVLAPIIAAAFAGPPFVEAAPLERSKEQHKLRAKRRSLIKRKSQALSRRIAKENVKSLQRRQDPPFQEEEDDDDEDDEDDLEGLEPEGESSDEESDGITSDDSNSISTVTEEPTGTVNTPAGPSSRLSLAITPTINAEQVAGETGIPAASRTLLSQITAGPSSNSTIPISRATPESTAQPESSSQINERTMSPEVEHFLIAVAAILGVCAMIAGGFIYLRFNPKKREQLLNKVFPNRAGNGYFSEKRDPDASTVFSRGGNALFGRIIGTRTESSRDSQYLDPPPPAALALDDNRTERRYSRQNLVRASLLQARSVTTASEPEYTEYATPPPVYSGYPPSDLKEKDLGIIITDRPASQPLTDIYVPDGIQYTQGANNTMSSSRGGVPIPPIPDTPTTTITTTTGTRQSMQSEPPRFRSVNSWASNQAHRLENGRFDHTIPPTPILHPDNIVRTNSKSGQISPGHRRQASSQRGRFPVRPLSGSDGSRTPRTPVAFRQHPGERMDDDRSRIMSAELDYRMQRLS